MAIQTETLYPDQVLVPLVCGCHETCWCERNDYQCCLAWSGAAVTFHPIIPDTRKVK